jgi:hypothetical protein
MAKQVTTAAVAASTACSVAVCGLFLIIAGAERAQAIAEAEDDERWAEGALQRRRAQARARARRRRRARCNLDPISHFVENRPRFGCDSRARILQLDGGQLKGSARQDQLNRAE